MKGVQCYELFGGIALKIHTFSFSLHILITVTLGLFQKLMHVYFPKLNVYTNVTTKYSTM